MDNLREEITKIICPLKDIKDECFKCTNELGCVDSWPDIKLKVNSIINLLADQGYGKMIEKWDHDVIEPEINNVFQPIERIK